MRNININIKLHSVQRYCSIILNRVADKTNNARYMSVHMHDVEE